MRHYLHGAAAALALACAAGAGAATITFDDLAVGTILSNQYSAQGVIFSANSFSGAGGPTSAWASNTNMTIVSSTGPDVGSLGPPALVSGNILRSFSGWVAENGDPSFAIDFTTAVSSFSLDFAGASTLPSTRIFAYDGATLLTTLSGGPVNGGVQQFTLSYSAPSITRLIVTPGDFFDWVGVDNLVYTPVSGAVPEPSTWAMMIAGFGFVGAGMRRKSVVRVAFS